MRVMEQEKPLKTSRIDIKTLPKNKDILQQAAFLRHTNLTDFLIEAGLREAERLLADQRIFFLNDKQFKAFQEALEKPLYQKKPKLRKLLKEPSIFEK